jgi:hypothetical protein
VLADTLARLAGDGRARLHALAAQNLAGWAAAAGAPVRRAGLRVRVVPQDWGVAALQATRETGVRHAVLNMAHSRLPGGRYIEGTSAQEENMFRRTDCHFSIDDRVYDRTTDRYLPHITELLEDTEGRVMLDVDAPRVCFRGPEVRASADLGYAPLSDGEVFPFIELRAAARDCRRQRFDAEDMRRRIKAQRETLREHGVTHVVLSAFGCGAFRNPADGVAKLYREVLEEDAGGLKEVTFAIIDNSESTGNYGTFVDAFEGSALA